MNRKDILDQFNLIIVIGPPNSLSTLQNISDYASGRSIPLFYVHSVGFYSHFSVQLPSRFPVVDTHPDPTSTQDLRLLNPWPELLDLVHAKTDDLHLLEDHEHGHIPYLLLLLHYLESWRASHDDVPPANYSEKKAFKTMVQDGARKTNAEGGEENYDEAAASVLKSLNPSAISSGLRDVFEADDCKFLKPNVSKVSRFMSSDNGGLNMFSQPTSGSLLTRSEIFMATMEHYHFPELCQT